MVGQEYYQEEDENSYTVPGDMRLTDFYNLTNFDIEDPVMTTIGGVAFRLFDRLPKIGDSIVDEGYEFVAREVTGLRISKLLVRKVSTSSEEARETEEEEVIEALEQDENSDEHLQETDIQGGQAPLKSGQSEVKSEKQEGHDESAK